MLHVWWSESDPLSFMIWTSPMESVQYLEMLKGYDWALGCVVVYRTWWPCDFIMPLTYLSIAAHFIPLKNSSSTCYTTLNSADWNLALHGKWTTLIGPRRAANRCSSFQLHSSMLKKTYKHRNLPVFISFSLREGIEGVEFISMLSKPSLRGRRSCDF